MTRVLIVDDEATVLKLETSILERAGYQVEAAVDGREGLGRAAREPFDVAIVDYQMPTVNGLEVLRELREIQPQCQRILCSGNLNLPVVMDAVNRGEISRVIQKPVTPDRLLSTVNESIAARERARRLDRDRTSRHSSERREALEECLSADFFQLALQPIVSGRDNAVFAYEALLRSRHKVMNNPMTILHAAEEHNLLPRLAIVVAELAADWLKKMPPELRLFLNMHPKELTAPKELRERLDILEPWADRVVAEITERTYVLDLEAWSDSLGVLSERGFSIAVDDMGSGYNSLAVLAELQPQFIKVDMSIVRGVDGDPRKQRLIEMLARFASSTEAELIAEGIETQAEAEALTECGVHFLQGYYFGRPSLDPKIPEPT